MKKIIFFLISAFTFISNNAYGQLTTFNRGEILSAETMNNNFDHLASLAQGKLKTSTVDCGTTGTGSGINKAIKEGYNSIIIKGVCKENLHFYQWYDSWESNNEISGLRYIRLVGYDENSKILDNSSDILPVIKVENSTLVIDNLTLEGGNQGINSRRQSNILLRGVSIKDFSTRGLDVGDSSYLGISSLSYIDGKDNSTRGIHLVNGASGWINDINIKDVDYGIRLFGSSSTYLNKGEIVARTRGVTTSTSRFLHYNGDDNST